MEIILSALFVSVAINLVMFLPAFAYKTDKLTDISYAISFAMVALVGYALSSQTSGQLVVLILVLLWALRIGTFLFVRINKIGKDKRFDGMRENFGRFLRFWVAQGVSVFVILLTALLYWSEDGSALGWLSYLGVLVFATGLLLETTADAQKYRFNSNAANKGKWIESGVWRLSRHPNYLGEIMIWCGMYLIVFMALGGWQRLFGLASPLFISGLLLFVSGVPPLEKSADKRWGKNVNYQHYKRRTPILVPTVRSLKAILSD